MELGAWQAQVDRRLDAIERQSRLSHASIDNAAVVVKDGTGGLRGIVGVQPDGTTAVNIVNGPPPPTPSAPALLSILGGVRATWDGSFTDSAVVLLDWARVEVHASTAATYTPDSTTLRGTIETAQGGDVVIPTDDPAYVLLVARNTSGAASAPSAIVGPKGPQPVVAQDILDGIVTTVKLADDAVTKAKVAAAAVTPEALAPVLADTVSQRWVDTMDDPDAWQILSLGTGASWTYPALADAPSGGSVGQASGYVTLYGTTQIPYDPNTLYRITVRLRASAQPAAGADTVYLGLMGFAADKITFVNRTGANSSGSQFYCVALNRTVNQADGWQVWTGFVQGRTAPGVSAPGTEAPDPLSPGLLHDQVRYVSPYLLLNYTQRDPAGVIQVDSVMVEALRTGVVTAAYLAAGSVSTSKLVAGAVQTAQLDTGAVNADKIASNAVTTAKLDALAVTADKIAANAIVAGKIAAGAVTATSLAATAIDGKTITGATIQTAPSGQRVVIATSETPGQNSMAMYSGVAGEVEPGELLASVDTSSGHPRPKLDLYSPDLAPGTSAYLRMIAGGGTDNDQGRFTLSTGNGSDGESRIYAYASDGVGNPGEIVHSVYEPALAAQADVTHVADAWEYADVNGRAFGQFQGIFYAPNMAWGRVTVNVATANTPGSIAVTGLNVAGAAFQAYVSPLATAVGNVVTGVGAASISSGGLTVYANRSTTGTVQVAWMIIGV